MLLAPLAAGLFLTACGSMRIAQINSDPTRYRNRNVRVEGTVTNSFGALGTGGYQVDDGTGKLYVISAGRGVPSKGSRVSVSGRVQSGVTIMGKSFGTALYENDHRVR